MATWDTVDDYVDSLEGSQRQVVERLRQLIRQELPDVTEAIKWSQPVFSGSRQIAYIKAFKNHVNLGFFQAAALDDPSGTLEVAAARMGHVKITEPADVDEDVLRALLRSAAEVDRSRS